jgi:hypothetical protein
MATEEMQIRHGRVQIEPQMKKRISHRWTQMDTDKFENKKRLRSNAILLSDLRSSAFICG